MTTRLVRALALSILCSIPVACGAPPVTPEDGGADAAVADAGTDADSPRALFSQCTEDADCASGDCWDRYPGGLCTTACTTDVDCGPSGVCGFGLCAPGCVSGDGTCAPWGACVVGSGTTSFCTSACWGEDRLPEGWTPCNEGQVCNEWRNRCTDPAMLPTTGAENGAPCTANADCLSNLCLLEVPESGPPSGYIGGQCAGTGLIPPDSEFVPGSPLPRSNCVEGSIILPAGARAGDFTLCLDECTTHADCREGYECSRGLSNEFASGACLPLICSTPGVTCPAGYECQTFSGLSRCVAM